MPLSMAHIIALPRRSSSQLAPEVHDMILDNLHDSRRDLSVCSVVCKSWLPLCRRHLFGEVNYRPDLAKLITSSAHATLTISPYIRKVTIKGNVLVTAEKDVGIEFISNLPKLQSLRIEKSNWDTLQSPIPLSFGKPSFWLQLSTLDLRSFHFPSFAVLIGFVESFSALQDLSLDSVSWDRLSYISDGDDSLRDSAMLKPSTLRKLHIAFCHNTVVLNWLQYGVISDSILEKKTTARGTHRSFPHLAVLSLPDIQPAEAYTLGVFLAAVAESLKCLEVGVLSSFEGFSSVLDLSSNTKLKTLAIHQLTLFRFPSLVAQDIIHSLNPPVINSLYSWLPTFMSTIQSASILSIEFHMWLSDQSQLDAFPWSTICKVLVDIGTPRIRLYISGIGRDTDLVKGWLIDRLGGIDRAKTRIEFEFIG